MIREIPKEEWKMTDSYKLNFEWDGHWVVFWSPKKDDDDDGTGYVVAYGNGTSADRDTLFQKYVSDRYCGQSVLQYGHKPSEVIECIIQQG